MHQIWSNLQGKRETESVREQGTGADIWTYVQASVMIVNDKLPSLYSLNITRVTKPRKM
jgi:hypothetical protein